MYNITISSVQNIQSFSQKLMKLSNQMNSKINIYNFNSLKDPTKDSIEQNNSFKLKFHSCLIFNPRNINRLRKSLKFLGKQKKIETADQQIVRSDRTICERKTTRAFIITRPFFIIFPRDRLTSKASHRAKGPPPFSFSFAFFSPGIISDKAARGTRRAR